MRTIAHLFTPLFRCYVQGMFSRLQLRASFEHVASEDEWRCIRSYGDVPPTDLWVNSVAAGFPSSPGKLDGYEELWTILAVRVREKLASGEWLAEGFDAAQGPQLQRIDGYLWRSLELEIHNEEAVGAGFRFVNLLISTTGAVEFAPADAPPARAFTLVYLSQVLKIVADEAEAEEFEKLRAAASSPHLWIVGATETQFDLDRRRGRELEQRLWERVLRRLVSGEWAGHGFANGSAEPKMIPPVLWPNLKCDFSRDEAYSAGGSALHFYHVTIRRVRTGQGERSGKVPGALRRCVTSWIRSQVAAGRGPLRTSQLLEDVRGTYPEENITRNLLEGAIKDARVPEGFLFKGRPRK